MSLILELVVPGDPVAQPRYGERVFMNHDGRIIRQRFIPKVGPADERGRRHGEHPIHAFKSLLKNLVTANYHGPLLDQPLALELLFVLTRPPSSIQKSRPNPRTPHTGRPDGDNLEKAVKDALNGVLWTDDRRVCRVEKEKVVGAAGEQPFTLIRVLSVEGIGRLASTVKPLHQPLETAVPQAPQKGLFP